MNIMIMGAGAIGSLFGGLLKKQHNVVLIGRKPHMQAIQKKKLHITGKTNRIITIHAQETLENLPFDPDLIILTVKAYDTKKAAQQLKTTMHIPTPILSLQNGLDNIENLTTLFPEHDILAATTTHGVFVPRPGHIKHTGEGATIIGELSGKKTKRIIKLATIFNHAGITTSISSCIQKEIWSKAVINASINPVTAIFQQQNGYLLENPVLRRIVHDICRESTTIANTQGFKLNTKTMIQKTEQVIQNTESNYSSMYQSLRHGGKTEIESITGQLVQVGQRNKIETVYSSIVYQMILFLSSQHTN